MGKIVYHGTFGGHAPHEYGGTFHAGTMRASHETDEGELWADSMVNRGILRDNR